MQVVYRRQATLYTIYVSLYGAQLFLYIVVFSRPHASHYFCFTTALPLRYYWCWRAALLYLERQPLGFLGPMQPALLLLYYSFTTVLLLLYWRSSFYFERKPLGFLGPINPGQEYFRASLQVLTLLLSLLALLVQKYKY
jgi:hypothetical protein